MGLFTKKKKETENNVIPKKKFGWGKLFSFSEINDDFYENLEEILIEADTGGKNSLKIIADLKKYIEQNKIKTAEEAKTQLKQIIKKYFSVTTDFLVKDKLNVFIIIGVNGVGKTSTIAKLTNLYKNDYKIVWGAADTFRAAAKEQLEHWGNLLDIPVISQKAGSDSASVAYDTVHSALSTGKDLAIIDTAGRLQNKVNLVEQLAKLDRVVDKFEDKINKKIILVLDAVLGQSGYEQVKIFKEQIGADGIVLTKLDSQAKGGMLISIAEKLHVPIIYFCHGEQVENISIFNVDEYLDSII